MNPGGWAALLTIHERQQAQQAEWTRRLMSLQAAEAASRQAHAQAQMEGGLRQLSESQKRVEEAAFRTMRMQCVALGHPVGMHDSEGRPQAVCSDCGTVLDHAACCTTPDLVALEGAAHLAAGAPARAAVCLSRALDLLAAGEGQVDPATAPRYLHPAWLLWQRGQAEVKLGLIDAALADFGRVIRTDPGNIDVLRSRAEALEKVHRSKDALADYDRIVALDPSDRSAAGRQAVILTRLDPANANEDLIVSAYNTDIAERTALGRNAYEARKGRFHRLLALGRYGEALDEAMRIVAYLGHLPNTGALREGIDQAYQEVATGGTRHLLADEFDAAVADFDRVLAVTPSDAGVLYQRACALASLGRSREALDSLSAAISLNSNLRSRARRDPPLAVLREDRDVGPLYAKLVPNGLVKRLFG